MNTSFLEKVSDKHAGGAGLLGPAVITVTIIVARRLNSDWHEWSSDSLSSLGQLGGEYSYVFNLGLIVTALLGWVFSIGLYRLEDRAVWKAGAIVYAVSHFFSAWQAVFPAGDPRHNWFSAFPFFVGALLLLGIDQVRHPESRELGLLVISNLFIGITAAYLVLQTSMTGTAILQTIGVTVFGAVTLVYSLKLLDRL